MPHHCPSSRGCCSFHSSQLVITTEKNKIAPLGFTSHVRGFLANHTGPEARARKGEKQRAQQDWKPGGIRTGYLGCQQGAHGRSVERTQRFR